MGAAVSVDKPYTFITVQYQDKFEDIKGATRSRKSEGQTIQWPIEMGQIYRDPTDYIPSLISVNCGHSLAPLFYCRCLCCHSLLL